MIGPGADHGAGQLGDHPAGGGPVGQPHRLSGDFNGVSATATSNTGSLANALWLPPLASPQLAGHVGGSAIVTAVVTMA